MARSGLDIPVQGALFTRPPQISNTERDLDPLAAMVRGGGRRVLMVELQCRGVRRVASSAFPPFRPLSFVLCASSSQEEENILST